MAASETNRLLEPGTYRVHAGSADYMMSGNELVTIEAPTARGSVESQALDTIAEARGYDRSRLLAVGIDLVALAAPVVDDSDMGAYSVSRLHSGSEDGYLWYVVTAEDDNPVDGTGHVSEESARYDASVYAAREDSYVETIESATPANPAACEARGTESSVRVEWFDTVVGAWFDMGEALSLDAARERIAGYCATDARERMGARYRIVCARIEEYRAIEAPANEAPAVYNLPPRFYFDHASRGLPAGSIVRETKRAVTVRLDGAEYAELLSDARHYAHSMGAAGYEDIGVISSARATVRALLRVGAPGSDTASRA